MAGSVGGAVENTGATAWAAMSNGGLAAKKVNTYRVGKMRRVANLAHQFRV
ncbi:MAG: hypothetical protein ACYC3X_12345 [Pirellulaceae bacterium]